MSSNYENTGKTVKAYLKTDYDAETNTSLKKSRMFVNNSELDKGTDRSNLNSEVRYISLVRPLNSLFLLLVFIGFNTCKV